MKASAIAYGGLLILLIVTSLVAVYIVGGAEPVEREVATIEGKLMSFANEADIFARTLNQSVDFISQRTAYELGLKGGINDPEVLWNAFYPRMDVLENKLEEGIKSNLPSKNIMGDFEVYWGETNLDVSDYSGLNCGPITDSKCFLVAGEKNFSVYDKKTQSRIDYNKFKISSKIKSSYFKILDAGRKIFEDPTYSSNLNDAVKLHNQLENDFPDLDFDLTASGDIVDITIQDNTCLLFYNDYYCLAPLKVGETGITDPATGKQIPYDYLKLKFKTQADQTGFTPPQFDFNIRVVSDSSPVKSGETKIAKIIVSSGGAIVQPVHLSYTVTAGAGGDPSTITVVFDNNDKNPNYVSMATVATTTSTIADTYNIKITGEGGGITKDVTFTVTVNPTMNFDIGLNPNGKALTQGEIAITDIQLTFLGGNAVPVSLYASGAPPSSTISFSPSDTCTPSCTPQMTIVTNNPATTPGIYPMTIVAIGGGLRKTVTFNLEVQPYFDFDISFLPSEDIAVIGGFVKPSVSVMLKSAVSVTNPVDLSVVQISKISGETDPGDFGIQVTFTPQTGSPNFGSDMKVQTALTTPYGVSGQKYIILVRGTSVLGGVTIMRTKTFTLTAVKPACFDDSDCDDNNPCTGVETEGKIDRCRNAGTVSAYCDRPNLGNGVYPAADGCGFGSGICQDKCDSSHEYGLGKSKACLKACNGAGACLASCSPSASDCLASDYGSDKTCFYNCKNSVDCYDGYFCNANSCSNNEVQCLPWCELGSCNCNVPAQRVKEGSPAPSCVFNWDCCTDWLGPFCTGCGWCSQTCTASCSYSDACTYGKWCPDQDITITGSHCGAPDGSCTYGTNSCHINAQCAIPGSEPTCSMNTKYSCNWLGYVVVNCWWEPPVQWYTATCS